MPTGGKEEGEIPGRKAEGETDGTLATATLRGEVAELRKLIAAGVDMEEKDEVNSGKCGGCTLFVLGFRVHCLVLARCDLTGTLVDVRVLQHNVMCVLRRTLLAYCVPWTRETRERSAFGVLPKVGSVEIVLYCAVLVYCRPKQHSAVQLY